MVKAAVTVPSGTAQALHAWGLGFTPELPQTNSDYDVKISILYILVK